MPLSIGVIDCKLAFGSRGESSIGVEEAGKLWRGVGIRSLGFQSQLQGLPAVGPGRSPSPAELQLGSRNISNTMHNTHSAVAQSLFNAPMR